MLGQRACHRPAPPRRLLILLGRGTACAAAVLVGLMIAAPGILFGGDGLDGQLTPRLNRFGFTGRVESTLTQPARPPDRPAAGEHRPAALVRHDHRPERRQHLRRLPLADERLRRHAADRDRDRQQRHRRARTASGPRNKRRAPMVLNTAFFPSLMWNSRFASLSGDPFDNSAGFLFPPPEGTLALAICRTCSSRRRSSRRPSAPRWPASRSPATTTRSAPRWCAG